MTILTFVVCTSSHPQSSQIQLKCYKQKQELLNIKTLLGGRMSTIFYKIKHHKICEGCSIALFREAIKYQ